MSDLDLHKEFSKFLQESDGEEARGKKFQESKRYLEEAEQAKTEDEAKCSEDM